MENIRQKSQKEQQKTAPLPAVYPAEYTVQDMTPSSPASQLKMRITHFYLAAAAERELYHGYKVL